jgi:PTS system nitrogen regulatory IIA component
MQLAEILCPERIACDVSVTSKKKVLEHMGTLLGSSDPRVPAIAVTNGLFARERLGSTGFGNGVALPHTRLENVERTAAAFMRLKEPVSYDAMDDAPVDLVFGLLVPVASTEEHLQILAKIAELLSEDEVRDKLRRIDDPSELLHILSQAG